MRNKKDTIATIYNFVKDYIAVNKYSPTYSHMSDTLKYSEGTISYTINYLVENGYLYRPKWGVLQLTDKEFIDG